MLSSSTKINKESFSNLFKDPSNLVPGPQSSHLVISIVLLLNFGSCSFSIFSEKRL